MYRGPFDYPDVSYLLSRAARPDRAPDPDGDRLIRHKRWMEAIRTAMPLAAIAVVGAILLFGMPG